MTDTIRSRLDAIRAELAALALEAGRPADAVRLVAVSKTKPADAVREALDAGQRWFGENRVQEGMAKFPALREAYPDLVLHLIGPLQTNKLKDALETFDVIETVDRPKLAEALAQAFAKGPAHTQGLRTQGLLIQVNTGEEPQKAGVLPREADDFIRDCIERLKLPIRGLMCIPPVDDEPSLHFALLRSIARRHGLETLSMGMSADWRLAVPLGATHVRIGSAIFGERTVEPKA
ncbi:YggS family pyridoxal phosphate enzyme [Aliidongia dinghuensis]|uniref:Pyridoxal phosphate homeostasis protein n=1 Tax=Aliidongia dinghuensis TaxID=1867774 RepID=A0A8J3E6S6_9PROT|nr:YggS family pyridoxal phosphate-dependent enzyme [Aliidongia dinghuensis]GGF32385.1 YggS family pyridoxal phosphate enzyme [Aliidongia dinghuensis]